MDFPKIRFILKERMQAKGLSQTQLAQRCQVKKQQINRLVKGNIERIDLTTLSRLYTALGCRSLDELFHIERAQAEDADEAAVFNPALRAQLSRRLRVGLNEANLILSMEAQDRVVGRLMQLLAVGREEKQSTSAPLGYMPSGDFVAMFKAALGEEESVPEEQIDRLVQALGDYMSG
ncbi:MAG: helix-turn-helix domain-containing protein [Candidatus Latescibacteria bacterium]|nr:helix-turn-helix domain-containing protein [Candidatus Latescibacterota bacterium]